MSEFPSSYFIFVQLGDNPSPTLNRMAEIALSEIPGSEALLITTNPGKWPEFPGLKIEYSISHRSDIFVDFVRRNRELVRISGGYWLFTLERIFSLRIAENKLIKDIPVIHFESDVFSMIDHEILEYLKCEFKKSAIPRYSKMEGIASILFSKSISQLISDLTELELLLDKNPKIHNDMALLGLALNHGIFDQLPSNPKDFRNGLKVLFDGAAYGQYIFGQDPLHNQGIRKSGYLNPNFDLDLRDVIFKVTQNEKNKSILQINLGNNAYRLANLHVHSKELVPKLGLESEFWNSVLKDANEQSIRIGNAKIEDVIHSNPVAFADKLRRARKIGFFRQGIRSVRYRLKVIMKWINLRCEK